MSHRRSKMSMDRRIFYVLFSVLICASLYSCGDEPYYSESKNTSVPWVKADSLLFTLPAPDTSSGYSMMLNIEHTEDYPFQNLYLRLSTQFPSGRRASDIINVDMADKAGYWYGDCNRTSCKITAPLRDNFAFSESGEYQVTIEQFTRREELPGIKNIELLLWKFE